MKFKKKILQKISLSILIFSPQNSIIGNNDTASKFVNENHIKVLLRKMHYTYSQLGNQQRLQGIIYNEREKSDCFNWCIQAQTSQLLGSLRVQKLLKNYSKSSLRSYLAYDVDMKKKHQQVSAGLFFSNQFMEGRLLAKMPCSNWKISQDHKIRERPAQAIKLSIRGKFLGYNQIGYDVDINYNLDKDKKFILNNYGKKLDHSSLSGKLSYFFWSRASVYYKVEHSLKTKSEHLWGISFSIPLYSQFKIKKTLRIPNLCIDEAVEMNLMSADLEDPVIFNRECLRNFTNLDLEHTSEETVLSTIEAIKEICFSKKETIPLCEKVLNILNTFEEVNKKLYEKMVGENRESEETSTVNHINLTNNIKKIIGLVFKNKFKNEHDVRLFNYGLKLHERVKRLQEDLKNLLPNDSRRKRKAESDERDNENGRQRRRIDHIENNRGGNLERVSQQDSNESITFVPNSMNSTQEDLGNSTGQEWKEGNVSSPSLNNPGESEPNAGIASYGGENNVEEDWEQTVQPANHEEELTPQFGSENILQGDADEISHQDEAQHNSPSSKENSSNVKLSSPSSRQLTESDEQLLLRQQLRILEQKEQDKELEKKKQNDEEAQYQGEERVRHVQQNVKRASTPSPNKRSLRNEHNRRSKSVKNF